MKHIPVPLLLILILATGLLQGAAAPERAANEPNLLRFNVVGPDMDSIAQLLTNQQDAADNATLVAHVKGRDSAIVSRPEPGAPLVGVLPNPTVTGGPLVFEVLDSDPGGWLKVKLPIRPNGSSGWVEASSVRLTINYYHVSITTSTHQLQVSYRGELKLRTEIAVGTGSTPTPLGSFYLTELLRPEKPDGIYGPFAFGLSGYSETLRSFNGGDGVIGLHGTDNPAALGSNVSHGCVRLHNDTIRKLASFLPLGTPVTISA